MPRRPPSHRPPRVAVPRNYQHEAKERQSHPDLVAAQRFRHTARWGRLRRLVLAEEPVCRDPYQMHARSGQIVVSVEVDHIEPLRLRPDLAFVRSNLQGLCCTCHAIKSGQDRRAVRQQGVVRV